MNEWNTIFSVTAESAATLTGLIFVATSINLAKILDNPALTDRALESMILLLNILIVSVVLLIPGQSSESVGIKLLIVVAITWGCIIFLDRRIWRNIPKAYRHFSIQNTVLSQIAMLPYLVAGIMMVCQGYIGLYWLVPGIIFSFIKAVVDAWVILVEIHR